MIDQMKDQMKDQTQTKEKPSSVITWNTLDIIQSKAACLQEDHMLSDDEAFEMASRDEFIINDEWDYFKECLDEALPELMGDYNLFHVKGSFVGWRNSKVEKETDAQDAESFIESVFPKTSEFTCKFEFYKDHCDLSISHHDSPTGEFYKITPCHSCEHCNEKSNPDNDFAQDDHICDYCLENEYRDAQRCFDSFLECHFDGDKHALKEAYERDETMQDESWNDYIDMLCKDGSITNKQQHDMESLNTFI